MYVELTPEDTLRDLQTLLLNSLPGFEFPRVPLLDNYTIEVVTKKRSEVEDDDLDYTNILDKLNAVGDSFSSSTDALASGLQNSAAVLTTQGNSIDQALALLTAGNNITQDMSKTSAGVRTISLRLAG